VPLSRSGSFTISCYEVQDAPSTSCRFHYCQGLVHFNSLQEIAVHYDSKAKSSPEELFPSLF
jgi:hypothetical protein